RKVRVESRYVQRELAFTGRFPANELAQIARGSHEPNLKQEFVVVQGVADLAVIMPQKLWIIDFKTDAITPEEMPTQMEIYAPQLKLYSRALSQIYRRPVSGCWLYFLA